MSFFVPLLEHVTIDPDTKEPIVIASQEDFNKALVTAMRCLYLAEHLNDLRADSRFRSYLYALDESLWGHSRPQPQAPEEGPSPR